MGGFDNLLKGAAWNAVQIAESLHEKGLIVPSDLGVFLYIKVFSFDE